MPRHSRPYLQGEHAAVELIELHGELAAHPARASALVISPMPPPMGPPLTPSTRSVRPPMWKRSHRIPPGDQKSVWQIPTALQEKADPHEIWPVPVSRSSVENSKMQAALFQEGRDRIRTITCRSQKGLEGKIEREGQSTTEDF